MKANIITIGNEILIGQIVDTNSTWLASELTKIGFDIDKIISISDSEEVIISTLENSFKRAELVILTGGLGPTKDDITKKTLAKYYNSNISFSEEVYSDVKSFLAKRGATMNKLNKLQATIPVKATILRNEQGTAPGLLFNENNKICICLPGVPTEMKSIMNQNGFTVLKEKFHLPYNYYHTLLITGIGESHLAERIVNWEEGLPNSINVAYLPSPGIIRLRIGSTGINKLKIEQKVLEEVNKLKNLIPDLIFGENSETLEEIVSKLLLKENLTISTAESCTGGDIARVLTSIPGSSNWYNGSVVAYSNNAKENLLGVSKEVLNKEGAVSKRVVELMAKEAKNALNTDFAVATSGIAGPDGGSEEKPVGTVWISVSGPKGEKAKRFQFGKERGINIKRTTIAALNMLREELMQISNG